MEWVNIFDAEIALFAHRVLQSAGAFATPVLKCFSVLGNGGAVFIVISAVLLLFRRTRRTGVTALLALLIGTLLTDLLLKHIVARPRPFEDAASVFHRYWTAAGGMPASGYSFPSGHTTAAMAFAMAIFLCGRKRFAWLSFFIPVLMGFSRIYFGVHYASDVAAGLAVGLHAGLAAWAAVMLLKRTKWFSRFLGARGITECFGKNRSHDEG